MPAVQVRDMPQELYDGLVERAKRDHRSISQEVTALIEEHLAEPPVIPARYSDGIISEFYDTEEARQARAKRLEEVYRRIDSRPHYPVPDDFPTPEELVREDRDR